MRRAAPLRLTLVTLTAILAACQESPAAPDPVPAFTGHVAGSALLNGGGPATVTDPDGVQYDARVAIAATTTPGGSVNIVFGPAFSAVWGAVPGVSMIHVWGRVESVSAVGGAITISGTATETDLVRGGERLVFPNEPFHLVVTGPDTFTFTWCALPVFDVRMTGGSLIAARPRVLVQTGQPVSSSLAAGDCPRG